MGSTVQSWLGLVAFLVVCFTAAGIGSALTMPAVDDWYATLAKPSWTPPNWVFAPVWSLLYALMAIAAWLIWRKAGLSGARLAMVLFALQLGLNVVWSGLFFGLQSPGAALLDVVSLWLAILATLLAFGRHSRLAAWLLAPYLLWVTYATGLNFAIWWMNR